MKHILVLIGLVGTLTWLFPSRASADISTLQINIIDVCGSDIGSATVTCAPTDQLLKYESFTTAVYLKAGITPSFDTPLDGSGNPIVTTLTVPASLNCFSTAATFCSQGLFDTVHTLFDTKNPAQSPDKNTLNVYLVNQLWDTSGSSRKAMYGYGLIGGNGAVVATGTNPDSLKTAALDTLSHEIGHNLGLSHVDTLPATDPSNSVSNLMLSTGRTTPFELCQVAPNSCQTAIQGTTAAASTGTTITLTNASALQVGMLLNGSGIPANDQITAINTTTNTVTVSSAVNVIQGAAVGFTWPNGTNNVESLTGASNGTALTFTSTAGLLPGLVAAGSGIPTNDVVTGVNGKTVTLAQAVTTNSASVSVTFSAPAETDQLVAGQIATVKNPLLLNQLPGVIVNVPGFTPGLGNIAIGCDTGVNTCTTTTHYAGAVLNPLVGNNALVKAIHFRFQDPTVVASGLLGSWTLDQFGDRLSLSLTASFTKTPNIVGGVEWVLTPTAPIPMGDYFDVGFTYQQTPGSGAGAGCTCVTSWNYTPPFSTQFDFTDGNTNRAGYDATGGLFSSDSPVFATYDPTDPSQQVGQSFLPTVPGAISPLTGLPVTEDTEFTGVDPSIVAAAQLPLGFIGLTVPEPDCVTMLGMSVIGLALLQRRRQKLLV